MKRLIILSNYLKHCRLWALVISEVWLNLPTWGATLSRGPDSCKRVERWNSRSSSGLHGLHRQRNLHWELGSLPVWIPGPLRALCIQRWSSPWECQTEPGGAARQMSQNTSFTQTQQKISQYYACAFHLTWRLLNQTVSCDRLSLLSACSNTTAWFIITTKVVHRDTWDTVCDKKCKKKETTVTVDKLSSHLYMHLRVRIHVVKQLLVVAVLLIPLQSLVIAEVISQRDKEDLAAVEFGLFAVLIQE